MSLCVCGFWTLCKDSNSRRAAHGKPSTLFYRSHYHYECFLTVLIFFRVDTEGKERWMDTSKWMNENLIGSFRGEREKRRRIIIIVKHMFIYRQHYHRRRRWWHSTVIIILENNCEFILTTSSIHALSNDGHQFCSVASVLVFAPHIFGIWQGLGNGKLYSSHVLSFSLLTTHASNDIPWWCLLHIYCPFNLTRKKNIRKEWRNSVKTRTLLVVHTIIRKKISPSCSESQEFWQRYSFI